MGEENQTPKETKKQDVFKDIEIPRKAKTNTVFKQFRSENEIGTEICKEFIGYGYSSRRKDLKGFYLSEDNKSEIGLITQCYGLITLSTLRSFGADLSPYMDKIVETINDVIGRTSEGTYRPTPYLVQEYEDYDRWGASFVNKYVDSIAFVLSSMVCSREILYDDTIFSKLPDKNIIQDVERLIVRSVRELNDSVIRNKAPIKYKIKGEISKNVVSGAEDMIYKGWNFAKCTNDEEMRNYDLSLYYTYSVSQAYMRLKSSLDNAIMVHRDKKRNTNRFSEEELREMELDEKFRRDSEFLASFSEDFDKFNEICIDVGHAIDYNINLRSFDISEDLIGTKFVKADLEEMMASTTHDALFNTLFAIGIIINTGVDLDYLDVSRKLYGNDTLQSEYVESLQYGLQNVEKCYKKFISNNKEYIVDQYTLNFNESIPDCLQNQAKLLRKQRIAPTSFIPLLIKVYFLISKYLIQYPQKQSHVYLEQIMRNRMPSSKNTWLWDLEGYNIIVNSMYIDVLKDFYDYYNEYELQYSGNINEQLRVAKTQYDEKISSIETTYEGKFRAMETELEDLKAENEALLTRKEPLVEEVRNIVNDEIKRRFREEFLEMCSNISSNNYEHERTEEAQAFSNLFISWYADVIEEIEDYEEIINSNRDPRNELRKSLIEGAIQQTKSYLNIEK